MPSKDVVVNVIGVDKGTSAMLKKIQTDAELAGTGMGNAIDKASTRVGNSLSKLGQTASNFGIPFAASISMIGDKFASTATKGQKFQATVQEIGKVSLLAGVGGLALFGGEAVKLGSALQESQDSLEAAITASGQSMTKWQGPISQTQQKMELLGFTNTQVNLALAHADISTQSMGKSLGIMSLAADLARAKHIDLTTATGSLDKAMTGNLRPLMQMGISLPIVATSAEKLKVANTNVGVAQANVNAILAKFPDAANSASSAHAVYETAVEKLTTAQHKLSDEQSTSGSILDALTKRLGGQAADAAQTFQGKLTTLKAQASDLGAQVGTFLIPKIEALTGFLVNNKGVVEGLATAIGVVLGAAVVDFAATKVARFIGGIKSMIDSLSSFILKMSATKAGIVTGDGAIVAENDIMAASFKSTALASVASLGPLLLGLAAVAAGYKLWQGLRDNSGVDTVAPTGNVSKATQEINSSGFGTLAGKNSSLVKQAAEQEVAAYTAAQFAKGRAGATTTKSNPQSNASAAAAEAFAKAQADAAKATNQNAIASKAQSDASKAASAATAEHAKQLAAAKAAAEANQKAIDKLTTSTKALVTDALNKAKTALATAQTAFTNFQSTISDSITTTFSFSDAQSTAVNSGGTFLDALTAQAQQTNNFTSEVQTLLKEGLSQASLQQVLAAGTSAGTDIANQLLQGGAAAINQANALTASVTNAATALGTSSATEFYGAGVSQAQSIVKGLTEESARLAPKLKAASQKIAENLKTQVEVDLKIISSGGTVPKLASGGIVTSPTLALIGEAGPEAVIPLGSKTASGGSVTYDFSGMTVVANDPQTLVNQLKVYMQRNGSLASAGIK